MEYEILIISLFFGALFRRWWGGWFSPNNTLKRILGFILPFFVCFSLFGFNWLCLLIPSLILFGWLMPYHGYGIGMGSNPFHPLWACIIIMMAQYGGLTAVSGVVWEFIKPQSGGLYYAPMGFMISLIYFLLSRASLTPWGEYPKDNWFIDGYTCYGELFLGAILVGGIPLAHIIAE